MKCKYCKTECEPQNNVCANCAQSGFEYRDPENKTKKEGYIYISPHAWDRLYKRLNTKNKNTIVESVYKALESKETSGMLEKKIKTNDDNGFMTYTYRQYKHFIYVFQKKDDIVLITLYPVWSKFDELDLKN